MHSDNPYAPPASKVADSEPAPPPSHLEGLGGWLILVGLGVTLAPLRLVAQVLPPYIRMFSDGSYAALTTPGAAAYNALWMPLLLVEIAINIGLVLSWIYLAIAFFGRRRQFPKRYIGIICFTLAFQIVDAWAVSAVARHVEAFDAQTASEIVRTVIAAVIWIPYMLTSKRVKSTFVR